MQGCSLTTISILFRAQGQATRARNFERLWGYVPGISPRTDHSDKLRWRCCAQSRCRIYVLFDRGPTAAYKSVESRNRQWSVVSSPSNGTDLSGG